jgi:hypothetical protein
MLYIDLYTDSQEGVWAWVGLRGLYGPFIHSPLIHPLIMDNCFLQHVLWAGVALFVFSLDKLAM